MTPFRIQCTTCQVRLSVRSERALGQLVTCPKCGSMVLVPEHPPRPAPPSAASPNSGATKPPAARRPARSTSAAAASLLGDDFDHVDQLLQPPGSSVPAAEGSQTHSLPPGEAAPTPAVPNSSAAHPEGQPVVPHPTAEVGAQPAGPDGPPIESTAASGVHTAANPVAADPVSAGAAIPTADDVAPRLSSEVAEAAGKSEMPVAQGSSPLDLTPATTMDLPPATTMDLPPATPLVSPATQIWRLRLFIATGVVGTAVATGAIATYWNRSGAEKSEPSLAKVDSPNPPDPVDSANPAPSPQAVETPNPPDPSVPTNDGPPAETGESASQEPHGQTEAPAATDADPAQDVQPDTSDLAEDRHVVQRPAAEESAAPKSPEESAGTSDPPRPPAQASVSQTIGRPQSSFALPDYSSLFGNPTPTWSARGGSSPLLERPSVSPAVAAPVIDVAGKLQQPLAGIDLPGMPLHDFWNLFTRLSGVPVSVEPDALALAGVALDSPVRVQADQQTLESILEAVLRPLRLSYTAQRYGLEVTHRPTDPEMPEVRYEVGDLAAEGDAVSELAGWISRLIVPGKATDGQEQVQVRGTTLVIRQSPLTHFQVLRVLEQLRVARGLPVRSRFPKQLFALQADPQVLDADVSIHYWMPRPLMDLLEEWTKQTGVPVLVDWSALALEGWTPSTATVWTTGNTSARDALTGLCQANEWTYRWLPIGAVHITSRSAAASRETVQLYPLGPWKSEGQSLQQAGEALYQAARQAASSPDSVVLVIDAPSQTALVRTDQLAHQALRQPQGPGTPEGPSNVE